MSTIASIPYIGWIPPFLVVLGVVIAIHEYGHYIVGRWCGIKAEVFSIGFGKPIYSWIDKRGTRWQIAWIPLGGYVKFLGDMNAASAGADDERLAELSEEERKGAFHLASLWRRALTVAAGPVFNFILTIAIFMGLAFYDGRQVNEPVVGFVDLSLNADIGLRAGDRVISLDGEFIEDFTSLAQTLTDNEGRVIKAKVDRGAGEEEIDVLFLRPAHVSMATPGGPAADAGLRPNDIITAANGVATPSFASLAEMVVASNGEPLALSVLRGGETIEIAVTPRHEPVETANGTEMIWRIGVQNSGFGGVEPKFEAAGLIDAFDYGVARTVGIITATLDFIYEIFAGRADASMLGGPIQIAKVSDQAAEQGLDSFIVWIALISTSIGLINLFPIPVLDGGHLVFYAIEALRGRPLRARWQEIGNGLGLSLILLLMVFATYNDLLR